MKNVSRARIGLAIGLALLLFCAAAAGVTIVQLRNTATRVAHSMAIEVALSDIESDLSALGRARANYVAAGDAAAYAAYQAQAAQIPSELDHIRDLEQGIPAHAEFYSKVRSLAERRVAINSDAVEARRTGQAVSLADTTAQIVAVSDDLGMLLRDMETHEAEFTRQREHISDRLYRGILAILGCTFVLAVGLLYWNYRILRAELVEIERAERTSQEHQESLRRLSARLLQVQDGERRRLSRELHDSLGQSLVLAKMNLAPLAEDKMLGGIIDESLKYLDQSIAETRTISYLLHPPLLDDIGFASAAEWLVEGFAQRSGIEATILMSDRNVRLPHAIELTLFRILQECLTNIHRHSGAVRAEVSFELKPREAALKVRDYGRGMARDILTRFRDGHSHGGVGLAGMRERVHEQGGRLEILSDGGGTSITVILPIAEGAAQHPSTERLSSNV
jgi:signal transduction histidine kinase